MRVPERSRQNLSNDCRKTRNILKKRVSGIIFILSCFVGIINKIHQLFLFVELVEANHVQNQFYIFREKSSVYMGVSENISDGSCH